MPAADGRLVRCNACVFASSTSCHLLSRCARPGVSLMNRQRPSVIHDCMRLTSGNLPDVDDAVRLYPFLCDKSSTTASHSAVSAQDRPAAGGAGAPSAACAGGHGAWHHAPGGGRAGSPGRQRTASRADRDTGATPAQTYLGCHAQRLRSSRPPHAWFQIDRDHVGMLAYNPDSNSTTIEVCSRPG